MPSRADQAADPAAMTTSSTAAEAVETASHGLRRTQRQTRSHADARRASTGRSARKRRRSSAIAVAVAYRRPGSLAIAFRTIVSRSRGMCGSSLRGRGGSSCCTRSTSRARSEAAKAGRSVSIS